MCLGDDVVKDWYSEVSRVSFDDIESGQTRSHSTSLSPRKRGNMFYQSWFVCLSVTTMTKKIVDGFVPNFMGRFLAGKGRPSSCFVMIGRGMW